MSIAYLLLLVWLGFRKLPDPSDTATTTCEPGETTLRMVHPNGAESVVVLRQITYGGDEGTYVEFVDRERYIAERMVTRNHKPSCRGNWHTEAEGCGP